MLFKEFVEICKRIRSSRSLNEKKSIVASYLKRLDREMWIPFILFLAGHPVPDDLEGGLGVGYKTLMKAFRNPVKPLFMDKQPSLMDIYNTFLKIAGLRGRDSLRKKESYLSALMGMLDKEGRRWIINIVSGEMRVGLDHGHLLSALAKAVDTDEEVIRRAYMLLGSLYQTVKYIVEGGDVKNVKPRIFRPLKPMLAQPADSVGEGFNILGVNKAAVEYKYDGFRIQIHIKKGVVRIFSRRLTEVTNSFPDVVEPISRDLDVDEAILDGEAIAIDPSTGRPLPFQDLMKRFRRQEDIDKYVEKMPVSVKIFDIIYLNGELLIDRRYLDRNRILRETVPEKYLADIYLDKTPSEAEEIFKRSIREGHEGIMIKRMDSPYILGSRGKYWVKIKEKETLDLVIVGAEWGHGRRRKWLSDYYLACRDPRTGEYLVIGKTFKGLTDEEFQYMTKKLLEDVVRDEGFRVFVKPKIVVEVDFNEVQKSPKYRSGYALRLARIKNIREDKSPDEIATIDDIERIYRSQFKRKGRAGTL